MEESANYFLSSLLAGLPQSQLNLYGQEAPHCTFPTFEDESCKEFNPSGQDFANFGCHNVPHVCGRTGRSFGLVKYVAADSDHCLWCLRRDAVHSVVQSNRLARTCRPQM